VITSDDSPRVVPRVVPLYRKLTFQLSALVMLVLVLVISLDALHTENDLTAAVEQTAREHADTLARMAAHGGENYLISGDYANLEQILLEIAAFPNVKQVLIVDAEARVVSRVDNTTGVRPVANFSAQRIAPPDVAQATTRIEEDVLVM